ncbi:hypothetical protein Tco_0115272, partial [Tanacetum coccineum]
MVPNNDKLLEAFYRRLSRSNEGHVTASNLKLKRNPSTYPRANGSSKLSMLQCKYRVTTKESLTTEELSTIAPAVTTTTATPTIATTIVNNKTEGKKLVEPMLLLHQKMVGMQEISLCARDAISIILDFVLGNVIFAT